MRILYVADGRSPIALNWIRYFLQTDHEVHLVSTFACTPEPGLASFHIIPVGVGAGERERGRAIGGEAGRAGKAGAFLRRVVPVGARTRLRQWLVPLSLPAAGKQLRTQIAQIQPDLVHAMRIPFEGMVAAAALENAHEGVPGGHVGPRLLISVWGNDFTLHAPATPLLGDLTRRSLQVADALHADCRRDVRLAHQWGFDTQKAAVVLPGAGGIQLDVFHPPERPFGSSETLGVSPVIINPRGFRAYVRNDAFFQAIPRVLAQHPSARFLCTSMAGEQPALEWVSQLGIQEAVELLKPVPRPEMAELFRRSMVAVSPSEHDGTPNTLLEAMACGCFPVAGNIESLREWITDGENGLLVDPGDPTALAGAILRALGDPELRRRAAEINLRLVAERAEYRQVMTEAEKFYQSLTFLKKPGFSEKPGF